MTTLLFISGVRVFPLLTDRMLLRFWTLLHEDPDSEEEIWIPLKPKKLTRVFNLAVAGRVFI